jgi:hypothetical protein
MSVASSRNVIGCVSTHPASYASTGYGGGSTFESTFVFRDVSYGVHTACPPAGETIQPFTLTLRSLEADNQDTWA